MAIAKYKSWFWSCAVVFGLLSSDALADTDKNVAASPVKDAAASPAKDEVVDPVEAFARAERAIGLQDVKEAMELLRKSAEQNYAPAQVLLGELLDYSEFDDEAVGWFLTAAYQGNPAGAFGLAKMYSTGEGIQQSDEKALYWFRFAAERNHLASTKLMSVTYKKGLMGQKIDLEQAKLWEDRLPALEAAEKREIARKTKIAVEAAKKAAKEAKEAKAAAREKYLESKAIEESDTKKTEQGATSEKAGQAPTK